MLNRIIGIVFSVTLSLSVGLILLILLELGDFLDADSRLGLFKITINALIFLLVSVVPIFIISLLAIQDILRKRFHQRDLFQFYMLCGCWYCTNVET